MNSGRARTVPDAPFLMKWWEKLDLNQRSLSATDLQSAPFDQTQAFSHINEFSGNRTRNAQIFRSLLCRLNLTDRMVAGAGIGPA